MIPIVIKTKSSSFIKDDISVLIDNVEVDFEINGTDIYVEYPMLYRMYKLQVRANTATTIEFDTVLLNECNIRELIYLAHIESNGVKHQPATILWGESGLVWELHLVYPLSRWIDINSRKFLRSDVASNIATKYHVMYPESINITHSEIPQAVKDFYKLNFDYTVLPKVGFDLREVPYLKYTREIPQAILDNIANEFRNNYEYLKEVSGTKTSIDSAGLTKKQEWKLHWLISPPGKANSDMCKFPAVQSLIDYLGIEVFYLFIGILPPGGFIYPHCDNYEHNIEGHERFDGCTQLYIPVIWPEGCSIKMANAGLVPLDQGTMLINADYVAHAGVNVGTENRFIIGLRTTQEEVLNNSEFI